MYTAVALSTARYRPHSSTHGDLMVSRTRMIIHRPCSFAVYRPYVLNHLPLAVCIIHHTRTVLEQNKDVVLFSLQDSWPMSHYSHPLSSLVVFLLASCENGWESRRQPSHFYRASTCEGGLGSRNSVCLSVYLSVCPSVTRVDCDKTKWRTADIFIPHERAITLIPRVVGRRRPLPSEICVQSDPPPFEKRRLRPISAHNVSTVGYSEKSSITTNIKSTTGFPRSHRWSAYVTLKCPKGWLKERFFFAFEHKSTADRLKRCQLTSSGSVINIDGRPQYCSHIAVDGVEVCIQQLGRV